MVFVILPAYNEATTLLSLFQSISKTMEGKEYHIILVDDGSNDDTFNLACKYSEKIPLEIIRHRINKGLGEAIKTGIVRVISKITDNDVIVTMDADNTHNPALIFQMEKELNKSKVIVIASRYKGEGKEIGLSFIRHFLSKIANIMFKILFPLKGVKDYTSGYRVYRGWLIKKSFKSWGERLIEEKGFTCMVELLIKLSKFSSRIGEVPLVLRYDFKKGKSKMKVMRTILQYFFLIGRNKLNLNFVRLRRTKYG